MNFFERRESRAGSGQNPLPAVSSGGIFGSDIYYEEPKEKPTPIIPPTALKKVYGFSVEVPAKYTDLYGSEISNILKGTKVSWEMVETFSPPSKIHVKLLAYPSTYNAIKHEIENILGLTIEEATE